MSVRILGQPNILGGPVLGVARGGQTYADIVRFLFPTNVNAPIPSPYTEGLGSLTITDASNRLSITGGAVLVAAAAGTTRMVSDTLTRAAGLTLMSEVSPVSGAEFYPLVYGSSAATRDLRIIMSVSFGTMDIGNVGTNYIRLLDSGILASTSYRLAIRLRSTGQEVYFQGGSFSDMTLLFVDTTGSSNYPGTIMDRSGSDSYSVSYLIGRQFNDYATDEAFATVNQASPVSLTTYGATASQVILATITAPGTLANAAGVRWRIQDSNNYHFAGFDSAGAFRAYKVVAGVVTEYSSTVNVAGVITTSATRTIQIVARGNTLNFYTLSGTAWTRRVSAALSDSSFNTSTDIAAEIGSGWGVTNLRSYPTTLSAYNQFAA